MENTVGKGENAHYEQFFLFPQCFQKTCTADTQKPGLIWERVKKKKLNALKFSPVKTIIITKKNLRVLLSFINTKKSFENIMLKEKTLFSCRVAEPHSSVGSVADLRTGGRWFDSRFGQYSILS